MVNVEAVDRVRSIAVVRERSAGVGLERRVVFPTPTQQGSDVSLECGSRALAAVEAVAGVQATLDVDEQEGCDSGLGG